MLLVKIQIMLIISNGHKLCIKCKETKELSEFSTDNKRKDKKNVYCKRCH